MFSWHNVRFVIQTVTEFATISADSVQCMIIGTSGLAGVSFVTQELFVNNFFLLILVFICTFLLACSI